MKAFFILVLTTYVSAAASGPTERVFVTNERANTVSVISGSTLKVEATIAVGKQPRGIGLAPDGSALYVVLWAGKCDRGYRSEDSQGAAQDPLGR